MDYGAFRDGLANDADGHLMLVDNLTTTRKATFRWLAIGWRSASG